MARSATTSQYIVLPGGNCQLSIPTTDTKFRPKATGARNESSSISNFVICPFTVAPAPGSAAAITDLGIYVQSLDGTSRNVACTAVVGAANNVPFVYSSKTFATPANTNNNGAASWIATDFGGTVGTPIAGSAWLTVTCNLPPQTQISYLYATYKYEIGT
jgi:hypothetical protein